MADQAVEALRRDLNMNVEQWKHKFLYPFGNIAPIADKISKDEDDNIDGETDK